MPVRIVGYGGTERVAIPIGVIIGQALLNFLIRALLTITIGGIIFAEVENLLAEISRQSTHNHFMATLSGGRMFGLVRGTLPVKQQILEVGFL